MYMERWYWYRTGAQAKTWFSLLQVEHKHMFEPYTLARKASIPCYHPALMGRNFNKISQLWALSLFG